MKFNKRIPLIFVFALAVCSLAFPETLFGQTISAEALQVLVHAAQEADSDALVIYHDGQIILEEYFGKGAQEMELVSIQSMTKSFSSLLIGILVTEGKIKSVDEPVSHWFPAWADDPMKSQVTLRMLLNHTSGVTDREEDWKNPDMVQFYLNQPLTFYPGTNYSYTTGGVALLAPIIQAASGLSAEELMRERLFKPLGIQTWSWYKDNAGNVMTGGGLMMRVPDLIKLGQLLLNEGEWQGTSLISKEWLHQSIRPSQKFFPFYGLLWWLYGNSPEAPETFAAFSTQGYGGQYLTIYPEKKLVAIRVRHLDQSPKDEVFKKNSFYDFPNMVGDLVPNIDGAPVPSH